MDVYCPKCGEPWDIDTFHDVADERDLSFAQVSNDFAQRGCLALGTNHNITEDELRASASDVLFDVLGDDIDGIASMLEDFEYFGMLD